MSFFFALADVPPEKFVNTICVGKVPLQPNRGYQSVLMGNFFRH